MQFLLHNIHILYAVFFSVLVILVYCNKHRFVYCKFYYRFDIIITYLLATAIVLLFYRLIFIFLFKLISILWFILLVHATSAILVYIITQILISNSHNTYYSISRKEFALLFFKTFSWSSLLIIIVLLAYTYNVNFSDIFSVVWSMLFLLDVHILATNITVAPPAFINDSINLKMDNASGGNGEQRPPRSWDSAIRLITAGGPNRPPRTVVMAPLFSTAQDVTYYNDYNNLGMLVTSISGHLDKMEENIMYFSHMMELGMSIAGNNAALTTPISQRYNVLFPPGTSETYVRDYTLIVKSKLEEVDRLGQESFETIQRARSISETLMSRHSGNALARTWGHSTRGQVTAAAQRWESCADAYRSFLGGATP